MKEFTYRLIPDHGRSRDWALAKSRYQCEDLELIPCQEVVWQGRLRFCLRWGRSPSWPCFVLDGGILVDRGILTTSYRRWVGVDDGLITDSWPRGIHPIWVNTKRGDVSLFYEHPKQFLWLRPRRVGKLSSSASILPMISSYSGVTSGALPSFRPSSHIFSRLQYARCQHQ